MRRKDRERDRNFALDVIDRCDYGVISLVTPDGHPYCVPLSVVRIENEVYFHTATEGTKLDILRMNPYASLACVTGVQVIPGKFTTAYESAVVCGNVTEITDEKQKIAALRALCLKFTPDNMDDFDNAISRSLARTGIWKLTIESITGKCKENKAKNKV